MSSDEKKETPPVVQLPEMCRFHAREVARRLGITQLGTLEWAVGNIQLGLFERACNDARLTDHVTPNAEGAKDVLGMNPILAALGCLACHDRRGFDELVRSLELGPPQ